MADENEVPEGVQEAPAAAPAQEVPNTPERLHALEQKIGLLTERVKFLEEHNTQLQLNVREEAMRLLGMTFATMGENLLTSAASRYKYQAHAIGPEHPVNDNTFYAIRDGAKWAYHILENGEIKPFEPAGMVEPMRKGLLEFMMDLPSETKNIAFNLYRA